MSRLTGHELNEGPPPNRGVLSNLSSRPDQASSSTTNPSANQPLDVINSSGEKISSDKTIETKVESFNPSLLTNFIEDKSRSSTSFPQPVMGRDETNPPMPKKPAEEKKSSSTNKAEEEKNTSKKTFSEAIKGKADTKSAFSKESWADISEQEEAEVKFLNRRDLTRKAKEGEFHLPVNLGTYFPRPVAQLKACAQALGFQILYDKPALVGKPAHAQAWDLDPRIAQDAIVVLNKDESKQSYKALLSLSDYFESLVRTFDLGSPIRTNGLGHAMRLFALEWGKYSGYTESATAKTLAGSQVRPQLLSELMTEMSEAPKEAADLLTIWDQALRARFRKFIQTENMSSQDAQACDTVIEWITKSLNSMEVDCFRQENVKVFRPEDLDKKTKRPRRDAVPIIKRKICRPFVITEGRTLNSVCTDAEISAIHKMEETIENSLKITSFSNLIRDKNPVDQLKYVRAVVQRAYRLGDATNSTIKSRTRSLKARAFADAKERAEENEAEIKAVFNAALWSKHSAAFKEELKDQSFLIELRARINELQQIISLSEVIGEADHDDDEATAPSSQFTSAEDPQVM